MKRFLLQLLLLSIVLYTMDKPVTVAWDVPSPDPNRASVDHYELVMIRDVSLNEYWYATPNVTLTIPKPKSGIYELKVRAVGPAPNNLKSDFCSSLDLNCARAPDGVTPQQWKIYWKPSGVLGPIIITPKSSYWYEGINTAMWDRS